MEGLAVAFVSAPLSRRPLSAALLAARASLLGSVQATEERMKTERGDLELRLFGLSLKTRRYGQVQCEIEMLAVVMAEPCSPEGVKRVKSYLSE